MCSKLYSILLDNGDEKQAIKGVKRSEAQKINHEHFGDCLFQKKEKKINAFHIRNKNHILKTQLESKVALNYIDNKRYILPDGIHTMAYGHVNIPTDDDFEMGDNLRNSETMEVDG